MIFTSFCNLDFDVCLKILEWMIFIDSDLRDWDLSGNLIDLKSLIKNNVFIMKNWLNIIVS